MKPKKPNSAERKVAKVRLSSVSFLCDGSLFLFLCCAGRVGDGGGEMEDQGGNGGRGMLGGDDGGVGKGWLIKRNV